MFYMLLGVFVLLQWALLASKPCTPKRPEGVCGNKIAEKKGRISSYCNLSSSMWEPALSWMFLNDVLTQPLWSTTDTCSHANQELATDHKSGRSQGRECCGEVEPVMWMSGAFFWTLVLFPVQVSCTLVLVFAVLPAVQLLCSMCKTQRMVPACFQDVILHRSSLVLCGVCWLVCLSRRSRMVFSLPSCAANARLSLLLGDFCILVREMR